MRTVGGLRSLLSLLTRIPVGGRSIEEAAGAFYLVPLVGALEGAIVAAALVALAWLNVNPVVASILANALHVLVTGGIHLDGFADYSDVVGSLKRGEQALNVLKDPRKGSFAIVATSLRVCSGLAAMSALVESAGLRAAVSVVALYVASAEAMFVTCLFGGEEPYDGMAKLFSRRSKEVAPVVGNILCYSSLSALLAVLGKDRGAPVLALLSPLAVGLLVARDANKRLGFVNGDVLGFSYELTILVNLVLAATSSAVCRPLG